MDIVRAGGVTIRASKISTRRVGRRVDSRGYYWDVFRSGFTVNCVVGFWFIVRFVGLSVDQFVERSVVSEDLANDLHQFFEIRRVIIKAGLPRPIRCRGEAPNACRI